MYKLIIGSKYKMREYPNLQLPDLHTVKIVGINNLNDGKQVIVYEYGCLFFKITKYMYYEDFIKNVDLEIK
jgi:hypothetical protein